ncbi:carboxypeptidase-like regulatory domain-containing protein, partial [Candidatus Zixiibacteriota bacterium]
MISTPGTASLARMATADVDTTSTDASGGFTFTDVEPGTYTIYAQGGSTLRAVKMGISVTADLVTDVGQLALTPTGTIAGSIQLEGETDHSGAVVFVAGTSYAAWSDASGDFTISGVPVGTYTVIAASEDYRSAEVTGVIVTAGETTTLDDIDLFLAPVIGSVVFEGTVELPAGTAGAGVLILARAIDTDGNVVGTLGSTSTETDGSFALAHPDQLLPSTFIALEALTASGSYFAFASSSDALVVGPVSNGVFEVVGMVVATPDGRSVADFSVAEIVEITTAAGTALTTAGTDLSDRSAVRDQIIEDVGGLIADNSEGTYAVSSSIVAVSSDPPDAQTFITSFPINLIDGGGED